MWPQIVLLLWDTKAIHCSCVLITKLTIQKNPPVKKILLINRSLVRLCDSLVPVLKFISTNKTVGFLHSSGKLDNLLISPKLTLPPPSAVPQENIQQGGSAEEVEGPVSPRGSAGELAVAGQLWLRHRLDGVFLSGLQCSGRGELLHKARYNC